MGNSTSFPELRQEELHDVYFQCEGILTDRKLGGWPLVVTEAGVQMRSAGLAAEGLEGNKMSQPLLVYI